MATTITAIALTLPSSDPNPSVPDTFTMRLTTTHGGHGGDNTNSIHFEISENDSTFIDLTAATNGLTVAATNPVTWSSGTTVWDITVTAANSGTFYVRGSSTGDNAFSSASQVVTVAAGDIDVTVTGIEDPLILAPGLAIVNYDVSVDGILDALILTEGLAEVSVSLDVDVTAITDALTLTEGLATVDYDVIVDASVDRSSFNGRTC